MPSEQERCPCAKSHRTDKPFESRIYQEWNQREQLVEQRKQERVVWLDVWQDEKFNVTNKSSCECTSVVESLIIYFVEYQGNDPCCPWDPKSQLDQNSVNQRVDSPDIWCPVRMGQTSRERKQPLEHV
ncbi:hypothetical protein OGAPHI_005202 [Ogataea philodendri]|uniref:Uncharacterized protein n=1 Tax=Ogataea philodendri TaxID=1378263 RepID=A0A9P8T341_9ASCO|nr:uncharacterized protein OGAPHI_005202 [Ogataea philodendri]KAH3663799.1 hypothetical protein OGAPHI_005202 [Ogataea philodendri]